MSRLRKALLGLLVALGLMAVAEGAARLLTGEPDVPVVVTMPDGREGLWEPGEQGLTPRLAEHAEWWPQKPAEAGRVVLLGGSSLAAPPGDETRAGALLAEALGVQVVNLAVSGMDSGHLVATAPGVVALEPDVAVIYSGHNDLGNAVFERRYADPAAVGLARARVVLGHSRIFELLEASWRGREERSLTQHHKVAELALSSGQRAAALADYRRRLDAMVGQLQEGGVPVVLATVVSNPAFPSVSWRCPDRMRALGAEPSHRAVMPLTAVDPEELAAARAEESCADLDLVAARLAWDAGEVQAAAAELDRLRDEDPVPLRAPGEVNRIIREVALQREVVLADVAEAFRERGQGVEPPLLFKDQVHVNELGEQALVAALAPAVAQVAGLTVALPQWPELPTKAMSECLSRHCPRGRRGPPPRPGPGVQR